MAVIGARPATGIGIFGRRGRTRTRPLPRGGVRRVGAGRPRVARAVNVPGIALAIVAAACLAFFYLSQSTSVAATGYRIDAVEQRIAQVRQEQQQLLLAIGEARAPARIEARATKELALQPIPDAAVQFARTPAATTR